MHLLGAALEVGAGLLLGGEDAGRLDDVVRASLAPRDLGRVALLEDLDLLAVDHEVAALDRDVALEQAVRRVVLELASVRAVDSGAERTM